MIKTVSKTLGLLAKPLNIQECANWKSIDKMIYSTNPELIEHESFVSASQEKPPAMMTQVENMKDHSI